MERGGDLVVATIIVTFNLKKGVAPQDYERWARERDVPTVTALASVDSFRVQRATGLIGSDAAAPYHYLELIEVNSLETFMSEIGTKEMQGIAAEFAQYAEHPTFILTERSG
jgi:hypothetical protein